MPSVFVEVDLIRLPDMLQGELKLKDFEIEKKAEGVDRPVIKNIRSVPVTNKSLEIHSFSG
jgi:hypothetical protein